MVFADQQVDVPTAKVVYCVLVADSTTSYVQTSLNHHQIDLLSDIGPTQVLFLLYLVDSPYLDGPYLVWHEAILPFPARVVILNVQEEPGDWVPFAKVRENSRAQVVVSDRSMIHFGETGLLPCLLGLLQTSPK